MNILFGITFFMQRIYLLTNKVIKVLQTAPVVVPVTLLIDRPAHVFRQRLSDKLQNARKHGGM